MMNDSKQKFCFRTQLNAFSAMY